MLAEEPDHFAVLLEGHLAKTPRVLVLPYFAKTSCSSLLCTGREQRGVIFAVLWQRPWPRTGVHELSKTTCSKLRLSLTSSQEVFSGLVPVCNPWSFPRTDDMWFKRQHLPTSSRTASYMGPFFSRMRSEGSRFTLGVWGQGCVRLILGLRSQPSATVCVSAGRLSTVASASGVVQKAYQVDSRRRNYIAFAEEVSVWVICGAAVKLAFAEEVFVWVICVVVVILAFAEEVSVWVICGAAVISAFAEEVSVWVICGAAVIFAFAKKVSVWVICDAAVTLAFAEDASVWVICVK